MALRDDPDGAKAVSIELYDRFNAMKTYGKEPESLESIIKIFLTDFAKVPAKHVLKALTLHAQRSSEFPTTHDIFCIITRQGAKQITESLFVACSQIDPMDRTRDQWKIIREFEEERHLGTDFPDVVKEASFREENINLRKKNNELMKENGRLARLLCESLRTPAEKPVVFEDKVARTLEFMRDRKAPQADIDAFLKSEGINVNG